MLTPRKRLTKKALKEDKLVTFYFQARTWMDENTKIITIGAAAIVVVLIASVFIMNARHKAESSASVDLSVALRAYSGNDYSQAKPLLNSLVDSYGSTTSGKLGMYYLANSMFKTGEYEQALEYFSKFVSKFDGDDYIASSAMAGVAACYEQLEQFDKAAVQYSKTAKKYSKLFAAPEYFFKAARCYQLAGEKEKANEYYTKVVQDYPESEVKNEALLMKSLM